jgi:hypothetical protein
MKFEKIKEKIQNGFQYFLFNLTAEKPYLLAKGMTKTEIKTELKKKVIKNPEKYRETDCILMYFQFYKQNPKFYIPGDLRVYVHRFTITKKLSLEGQKKPWGYVYFKKSYLEREGFSYNYLRNIVYLIKLDKITFFALGQPGYNELRIEIEQAFRYYEKLKK